MIHFSPIVTAYGTSCIEQAGKQITLNISHLSSIIPHTSHYIPEPLPLFRFFHAFKVNNKTHAIVPDTVVSDKGTSSYGRNHKNKFVINNDLSVSYNGDLYLDMYFDKDSNV